MTEINQTTIWIKNPLAIFAEGSDGGVVIKGQKLIELVPLGDSPLSNIDEIYDASNSVVLPGLINTLITFIKPLLALILRL